MKPQIRNSQREINIGLTRRKKFHPPLTKDEQAKIRRVYLNEKDFWERKNIARHFYFHQCKSELRFIIANDTHLMVVAFAKSYHADLNKF